MMFELAHVPMPAGYGEAVLPVAACKAHLRVTSSDEDDLISALRDAAIEFVERYCSVKLGQITGMKWRAESLPRDRTDYLDLGVWPVIGVTDIRWRDAGNVPTIATATDFRFTSKGHLRPLVGGAWPVGVAGEVVVTFDAGFGAGEAPASLLQAVRLMLGHLYMNREAVVANGTSGEVPLGVTALCMPFRPLAI